MADMNTNKLTNRSSFGTDLLNQLCCKASVDDSSSVDLTVALTNAGCAVGGYFLGSKVLAKKIPFRFGR